LSAFADSLSMLTIKTSGGACLTPLSPNKRSRPKFSSSSGPREVRFMHTPTIPMHKPKIIGFRKCHFS
jgi:hypothetical protein